MTRIRTIAPEEATGPLAKLYRSAIRRAGKIYEIVRCQSLRPNVLAASTELYVEVMQSEESALTRAQREMLATAVSRANRCFY